MAILKTRSCLECENFEDRGEIDGVVLCAKGHRPGISCADFKDRFRDLRIARLKTRSCLECENFEDRGEIDRVVLCAKGHRPSISCADFKERFRDLRIARLKTRPCRGAQSINRYLLKPQNYDLTLTLFPYDKPEKGGEASW